MAIPKAIEHMRSGSSGLEIIPITSTDGLTYTGTAKSIKEYKDGITINATTTIVAAQLVNIFFKSLVKIFITFFILMLPLLEY